MEFHVWIGEGGGPVGFTLRPDVAEEVGHCGGRAKGSGAERQAADGSDLLLELAGDAGVQREVAAVVGAGGEFVDDELAALRDEEFDGEEADDPEFLQNAAGEFYGFLREVRADVAEGADMVMVKPAATYLDVIHAVRGATALPVAAYHVSGEYSMIKAAAERGWLDERQAMMETLTAIVRAGADIVITYAAIDAAKWMKEDAS